MGLWIAFPHDGKLCNNMRVMKYRISGFFVAVVFVAVPALSGAITLPELVELFINLGIIAPDKATSARAAISNIDTTGTAQAVPGISGSTAVVVAAKSSSGATGGACLALSRTLSRGDVGADVSELQRALQRTGDFTFPEITGFYGSATEEAVKRFQARMGVTSSGTPDTTGYGLVGPRTRAALAGCSLGSGSAADIPTPANSGAVGGILKVSPTSGAVPLAVVVTAEVNASRSCGAFTYTLEFGDGASEQIPVPQGTCNSITRTFTHTYSVSGTYTLRLGASGLFTTVSVTAGASNTPPANAGQGSANFSVSTASGPAPLEVTFKANYGGFTQGRFELDFGDGTSAVDVRCTAFAEECEEPDSIKHTYQSAGTYTAKIVHVDATYGTRTVRDSLNIQVGQPLASGAQTGNVGDSTSAAPQLPVSVEPGYQGDPFALRAVFDIGSPCSAYTLTWGDGTNSSSNGGGVCTQVVTTVRTTHTYKSEGTYTITLVRENAADVITVAIVN